MDDDFEIEVTDLRTGQVLKTARDLPAPPMIPAPATEADDRDFELEVTDLPAVSREAEEGVERGSLATPPGRGPSRRRVTGAVATGALVVVVLIGLLGGVVGKGGFAFGLFPTPVPTATLAIGADTFYMVNGVPWGKLLADGRLISVVYSQQGPAFFTLAMGHHTIEYDAQPFPKVTCRVSVPPAKSDSCPLFTPDPGSGQDGILTTNRGLDLGATLSRLSPEDLQALVSATAQSLTAPIGTTSVPVGGRYQGANGNIVVATEPLQAQLLNMLNTDPSSSVSGQSCVSLCDVPFGDGIPNQGGGGWYIMAMVIPIWRYTSTAGSTVQLPAAPHLTGTPAYQSGMPGDVRYVAVTWQGSWQVGPQLDAGPQSGCYGADVLSQESAFSVWTHGYSTSLVPAPNPADGCLMTFQESDGNGSSLGKPMWFLYRFGVIFAANPAAHQMISSLPVASGSEEKLAWQLANVPCCGGS